MAVDIDFIGNITNYQDIPDGVYPVLPSTSLTDIVLSRLGQQVLNSVLPDTTDVYVDWKYPVSDNLYFRAAVGYQLQVVEGTFSQAESQSVLPPGNLVFEHIVNLKYETAEEDQYIKLEQGANGVLQILAASLQPGIKYTVRARALVFSELGDGAIDDQYFKYTQWGVANFRVNTVPAAGNLRVNGDINPQRLPRSSNISFSFTFQDPDGPSYLYQMQVTDVPGNFSNPIWDSGTVSAGTALGNRDFSLSYGGPALTPGTVYGWRVSVNDGISDGGWTAGVETFKINQLPTVSSIKAAGEEMIYGDVPVVPSDSTAVSWTFQDADGDTQTAYNLRVYQLLESAEGGLFEILVAGNVFDSASSVVLPTLPDGGKFEVRLSVRDDVEFGEDIVGNLTSNAKPQALDLRIGGLSNPGNVPTTLPVFTWKFFDNTPGDVQQQYQVQVATTDQFETGDIVWDSGVVTSSNSSATCGTVLEHGLYYYVRATVSDGVSFSDYATGFFSVNRSPNSPTITSPGAGSYGDISSTIPITWIPATPLDPDGDDITYTLEMTKRRSSNQGWEYLAGPLVAVDPTYKTEYVVMVIMDGARLSETFGTPANIPNIMGLGGSLASTFYVDTPQTVTINGHDALMTGHYEDIANDGSESPTQPSLMAEWLYERGIVSNGTAGYSDKVKIVTSKDKLWCLRTVAGGGVWDDHIPYANCGNNEIGGGGYRLDSATHAKFKTLCLGTTPPVISLVSYAEPDTYAHAHNFAGYVAAIQQTDVYIGEIWSLIQAHPLMANKTLMVVTCDHGRHADPNYWDHGGTSEDERHVMFAAVGTMAKAAFTTGTYYGIKDVAATAMSMLGMQKVYGEGVVMSDIFNPQNFTTSYSLDISNIKSGNDYGIRVIANDGYADSDPAAGTSPVNVNGLGFTILNHAPKSPVFIYPKSDSNISSLLKVEWLEADPVDVDGDNVFYILEMTRNASVASPTYEKIGVYAEGVTRTFIDVSNLPDSSVYGLRITAQDDKGGIGTSSLSETFSIINTTAITDFETIGSNLYMSTSDGRIFKATSAIWQVDEEFKSRESMTPFEEFSRGAPVVNVLNGKLTIQSPTGSTYILRVK